MENPMTWKKPEHVVSKAIEEHGKAVEAELFGLSLIRTITDALRKEGLLKEDE